MYYKKATLETRDQLFKRLQAAHAQLFSFKEGEQYRLYVYYSDMPDKEVQIVTDLNASIWESYDLIEGMYDHRDDDGDKVKVFDLPQVVAERLIESI